MKSYRPYAPAQTYLLPPSPTEWLPEDHLAYFVLELLEDLDLGEIERAIQAKDHRGERPYAPRMMTALLLYGYAVGVFSSRKIARATYEDVGFRVLAAGEHPHFTTIRPALPCRSLPPDLCHTGVCRVAPASFPAGALP